MQNKKPRRIELHISAPQPVAEAIMLLIHNQSLGEYVEVPIQGGKAIKYEFHNGVVVGKLPMKILKQRLGQSKKDN